MDIGSIFFSIFIIFITLMLLIGCHELGHFTFAKLLGIKVLRFSLGFGKPLFHYTSKAGTEYTLSAFPIGGYVKMLDEREAPVSPLMLAYAFNRQPIYKRVLVILGGPLFNLIMALLAYWLVFTIGIIQPIPRVGNVISNSPAAHANIQKNQEILSINNIETVTWPRITMALLAYLGESTDLTIKTINPQKQQSQHIISLSNWQLDTLHPNPLLNLGIQPWQPFNKIWPEEQLRERKFSFIYACKPAFTEVLLYLHFNAIILEKLVSGKLSLYTLSGPIGLFQGTMTAAKHGLVTYLSFIAFISISLAFFNALPIPGLDGSHLLYLMIEWIRGGKSLSIAMQLLLFRLGIILLSVFMVQALANDILRLSLQ